MIRILSLLLFPGLALAAGDHARPPRAARPLYQYVGTWNINWNGASGTCEIHANGRWVHHLDEFTDWVGTWKQARPGELEIRERYVDPADGPAAAPRGPEKVSRLPLARGEDASDLSWSGTATGDWAGHRVSIWRGDRGRGWLPAFP